MKEYISREAAIEAMGSLLRQHFLCVPDSPTQAAATAGYMDGVKDADIRLRSIPAADVVEVRHGMWGIVESWKRKSIYRCSECGNFLTVRPDTLNGGRGDMNYCPNCGARMDGGIGNG